MAAKLLWNLSEWNVNRFQGSCSFGGQAFVPFQMEATFSVLCFISKMHVFRINTNMYILFPPSFKIMWESSIIPVTSFVESLWVIMLLFKLSRLWFFNSYFLSQNLTMLRFPYGKICFIFPLANEQSAPKKLIRDLEKAKQVRTQICLKKPVL